MKRLRSLALLAWLAALVVAPGRVEAVRLFEDHFDAQQLGTPDIGLTWQPGNNTPLPLLQNGRLVMDPSGGDQLPLVAQRLPIPSASSQMGLRIEFELSPEAQSAGVGIGGLRLDSGENQFFLPAFGNPLDRLATNTYLAGPVIGNQQLLVDSQIQLPTTSSQLIRSTIRSLSDGSGVEFDIDVEPIPQQGFVDLATFVRPYINTGGTGPEFPGGFDQFNVLSLTGTDVFRYGLPFLFIRAEPTAGAPPQLYPQFRWIDSEDDPLWSGRGNWEQSGDGGITYLTPAETATANSPADIYDASADFDNPTSRLVLLDQNSGEDFFVRRVAFTSPDSEGFAVESYAGSEKLDLGPSLELSVPPGLIVSQGHHAIERLMLRNDSGETLDNVVFDIASGSLTVEELTLNNLLLKKTNDGALLITGIPLDDTGGTILVDAGTVGGNGTIVGDLHNHLGITSPGLSMGMLTVDGNYIQEEEGALKIEIGGTGSFDLLQVSGTASLAGILEVSLLGSPSLTPGQMFTVLTATGGMEIEGLSLTGPAATSFMLDVTSNSLILEFVGEGVDADLDDDGDVDGRDFLLIQRIDPSLIALWQATYGTRPGSSSTTTAIPEPATLMLVAVTALLIGTRRWLGLL